MTLTSRERERPNDAARSEGAAEDATGASVVEGLSFIGGVLETDGEAIVVGAGTGSGATEVGALVVFTIVGALVMKVGLEVGSVVEGLVVSLAASKE